MRELGLKSVIVKKYKHHTTKVKVEEKDNILDRNYYLLFSMIIYIKYQLILFHQLFYTP